jgi:hypothetical protein
MARDAGENGTGTLGWTPLAEAPAGAPQEESTRIAPLLAELAELEAHIARSRAVNPDNDEVRGMEFVVKRIRARIWEGVEYEVEAAPDILALQLGVSAQTIRNWCRDPRSGVRSRRLGTRFLVDVQSARRYAMRSGGRAP